MISVTTLRHFSSYRYVQTAMGALDTVKNTHDSEEEVEEEEGRGAGGERGRKMRRRWR